MSKAYFIKFVFPLHKAFISHRWSSLVCSHMEARQLQLEFTHLHYIIPVYFFVGICQLSSSFFLIFVLYSMHAWQQWLELCVGKISTIIFFAHRICINHFHNFIWNYSQIKFFLSSEVKVMKSPKRINMKTTYENKEVMDNDGSCFSPRSLFALPPDGGSLMLDSLHYVDESSDQDLLLHVPSNGSFPQAELLHPTSSFGQQASTSNSSRYPHLVRP